MAATNLTKKTFKVGYQINKKRILFNYPDSPYLIALWGFAWSVSLIPGRQNSKRALNA